jgi:hypothetical protein
MRCPPISFEEKGLLKILFAAVRARSALPAALQKLAPWVRKFAAMQKLIVP